MPVVGEVYDNPNYSHILIGGQPFFILPSGELSGHVPVPSQGERLSPVHQQQQQQQQQQHLFLAGRQVYQGGGGPASYNLGRYRGFINKSNCLLSVTAHCFRFTVAVFGVASH